MGDTKKQALDELKEVKTDYQLSAWHDKWMAGEEYMHLSDHDARELEDAYRMHVAWIYGIGA